MAPRLRLDPEELKVDSFDPAPIESSRGTVFGQGSYPLSDSTCIQDICTCTYAEGTCDGSCMPDPCGATNINCNGCQSDAGCGSGAGCGTNTRDETCCTFPQDICSCYR